MLMMTWFEVAADADHEYYMKDNYYMKSLDNEQDKWYGRLKEPIGLHDKVTLEDYTAMQKYLKNDLGRNEIAGMDLTFSAPKSVSLMLAKDEQTKNLMIDCHQKAVEQTLKLIEDEYIQATVKHDCKVNTKNMIAARFNHYTTRADNDGNIDLQMHTHCVIENMTMYNNKMYAVNFQKITKNEKELGLRYRMYLAEELQKNGYELDLYDQKHGFFRIKGFNEDIELAHSHRRKEILKYIEDNNLEYSSGNAQIANLATRNAKNYDIDFNDILEVTKKEVFEKNKNIKFGGKEDEYIGKQNVKEGDPDFSGGSGGSETASAEFDIADFGKNGRQELAGFESLDSLQDLSLSSLDQAGNRADVLLPSPATFDMAEQQSEKIRNLNLFKQKQALRESEILKIADEAIKDLSAEQFSFTIKELRLRIMNYGVLWNISDKEALKLAEKCNIVNLGKKEGQRYDNYSTAKNIKNEAYILDSVDRCRDKSTEYKTLEEVDATLQKVIDEKNAKLPAGAKPVSPNMEQTVMIEHVLTNKSNLVLNQGMAGTGKTFACKYMKSVCDEMNIKIQGLAFTGKAADGLEIESGIETSTIHAFLNKAEKDSGIISENTTEGIKQEWDLSKVTKAESAEIIFVDEAGLVNNDLMVPLLTYQEMRGDKCKLVLSGDYDQLKPVGCGEPMKNLIKDKGASTCYLSDIRRQKDEELLSAVKASVKGSTIETFKTLEKRDCYHEISKKKDRLESIKKEAVKLKLDDYTVKKSDGSMNLKQLVIVSTNADRKKLNQMIRDEYVKRGELKEGNEYLIKVQEGKNVKTEKAKFAVNDRIIFKANDKKLKVMNGSLGQITRIDDKKFTVVLDSGETKQFYIDSYNAIQHAYAVTAYASQGMSVDKAICDMSTKDAVQDRNALYVDISRAKYDAIVFTDNKKELEAQTKEFCDKVTSKEFAERIAQLQNGYKITNNDMYKAPTKKSYEAEYVAQEKAIAALADSKIDIRSNSELIFKNMKKKLRADIKNKKPKNAPEHSNSSTSSTVKVTPNIKKASIIIQPDEYVRKIEDDNIKIRSRFTETTERMEAPYENPIIFQLKQKNDNIKFQKSQQQLPAEKSDDDFLAFSKDDTAEDWYCTADDAERYFTKQLNELKMNDFTAEEINNMRKNAESAFSKNHDLSVGKEAYIEKSIDSAYIKKFSCSKNTYNALKTKLAENIEKCRQVKHKAVLHTAKQLANVGISANALNNKECYNIIANNLRKAFKVGFKLPKILGSPIISALKKPIELAQKLGKVADFFGKILLPDKKPKKLELTATTLFRDITFFISAGKSIIVGKDVKTRSKTRKITVDKNEEE